MNPERPAIVHVSERGAERCFDAERCVGAIEVSAALAELLDEPRSDVCVSGQGIGFHRSRPLFSAPLLGACIRAPAGSVAACSSAPFHQTTATPAEEEPTTVTNGPLPARTSATSPTLKSPDAFTRTMWTLAPSRNRVRAIRGVQRNALRSRRDPHPTCGKRHGHCDRRCEGNYFCIGALFSASASFPATSGRLFGLMNAAVIPAVSCRLRDLDVLDGDQASRHALALMSYYLADQLTDAGVSREE